MATKIKNMKIDLNEEMKDKIKCNCCGRILNMTSRNFYSTYSQLHKHTNKLPYCKDCITQIYTQYLKDTDDIRMSIYKICRLLDFYYTDQLYESAYNESGGWDETLDIIQNGLNVWKKYIKTINSLTNYENYTFEQSSHTKLNNEEDNSENKNNKIKEIDIEQELRDKQNREDIIRIIGYDPFENEVQEDKSKMYAKLINMINEDTQEDEIKMSAIISIIKGQNQENKINDVITNLSSNMKTLKDNIGTIKSLTETKEKLSKSLLALAKDNKLTEMYSGHKSAGANTLSGILKKLREINLNEAQVNLFDIQTSKGMLQTARLSAQAQMETLNYGDDDLLEMIKFQRGKLDYYGTEYEKIYEENRRLRVLCKENNIDYSDEILEKSYENKLNYNEDIIKKQEEELEIFNNMIKEVEPIKDIEYAEEIIKNKKEEEKKKLIDSMSE